MRSCWPVKGDTRSAAYLTINPTGRVPALDDDGFVLWESNAINKYLCTKRPGNALYPDAPRLQADIDRWLSRELAHYNQQFGILSFQAVVKPGMLGQEPDAALVHWSSQALHGHAAVLERHLAGGRSYMVGDSVTLADYAVVHIESLKGPLPFDWSAYPNLNAYYERMRADPHWAKTAVAADQPGRVPEGATTFAA